MGSAAMPGRLRGQHPQDFATYVEQGGLPLHGVALGAARVTRGTQLLDAGCGAGLLAILACWMTIRTALVRIPCRPPTRSGRLRRCDCCVGWFAHPRLHPRHMGT